MNKMKYSLNSMLNNVVEHFNHSKQFALEETPNNPNVSDPTPTPPTPPTPLYMSTTCPGKQCKYDDVSIAMLDENNNIFKFKKIELTNDIIFMLIITLIIWVWALYLFIKNFDMLPAWAKVIGLLGLVSNDFVGGPLLTIFVVIMSKMEKTKK